MKKIRMCFPNEKTFREGFEEYILDCKVRNLREGTINHYQEFIYKRITPDTLISSMCQQTMAKQFSPFSLTLRLNIVGTVALLVLNAVCGTWAFSMSGEGWFYTLLMSWGTAIGATILFQTGIGLCGSENAAMLSTFEPLTSVIAGIFVLGDPASAQTGIGIFLVLAAVVALSVYEKAKK